MRYLLFQKTGVFLNPVYSKVEILDAEFEYIV